MISEIILQTVKIYFKPFVQFNFLFSLSASQFYIVENLINVKYFNAS